MFTFNTGGGLQFDVNDYAARQRQESERVRQTLSDMLSRHRAAQNQSVSALERNQLALRENSGALDRMRQNNSLKTLALLSSGVSAPFSAAGSQKPRKSRVPEPRGQLADQGQMELGGPMGWQDMIPQGFLRNLPDQQPQPPGNELNPDQVSQISTWEKNADEADRRLREQNSGLTVALAGTPEPNQARTPAANQWPSRGVAMQNAITRKSAAANEENAPEQPPAQSELTLQQRLRMMAEQEAPTSRLLQELADDRQRRASQPRQPGEIEIIPGLPSIDSMRLYQRQQYDPMMSPEQQRLKQTRDLTREQFGINEQQFQQEIALRQKQEANRLLESEKERIARDKLANTESETRRLGTMGDLLRGVAVDPEISKGLLNRLLVGLGVAELPSENPQERMERSMLNAQRSASRKAVLGEDREPLNPDEQLRVNQHFATAIDSGRAKGWYSGPSIESATLKENSETVRGSKSVQELLEAAERERKALEEARQRSNPFSPKYVPSPMRSTGSWR